ncbi:MAG: hypothetical protein A3B91_03120 [Candidatus Yanofskybacteria bacterium RIFCSPHIGHO2_02_FULL_41_29]|uniref:Uncharacterized protein n=1 Tax=Candidatus Yanofskybacteria bacterium RIFCSPHIGHO2_01_FULL_41_53 TaxID=1802663 RepID=A0A1F8EIM5_9BACT|nr:MAG: hypothetical protein A2650_04665 [Candidatus Yanofskybacteria bacterium RIFCSPHIGHO2_01_FULL_41_53]OGN11915.1 MAG: hypothetical protein A3B91_03120 [Candidatus Yanofskybacteria bacterium RIFCSPHIGHO2_02_FULL_41_29]OGN23061.1 MAG: hypothetical protein A2916_03595 [Candidatus Yanofskybacteria bacterium RIFCSPLOWO2_01_FULL_41_67]OGN35009.1 MAG: hypothetical protein A3F98_00985 [Candidatus Yanofskybacteria bacterium RIFCSPLOWO2_12_FULL_41_8]
MNPFFVFFISLFYLNRSNFKDKLPTNEKHLRFLDHRGPAGHLQSHCLATRVIQQENAVNFGPKRLRYGGVSTF